MNGRRVRQWVSTFLVALGGMLLGAGAVGIVIYVGAEHGAFAGVVVACVGCAAFGATLSVYAFPRE